MLSPATYCGQVDDSQGLQRLTHALRSQIGELTDRVSRRLREELPEFTTGRDPALVVSESERIAAAVRSIIDDLEGTSAASNSALTEATADARAVAQAGIDLNLLLRSYRVIQAAVFDVLLTEIAATFDDPGQQLAVQQRVSRFQFDWNDSVVAAVIQAYQDAQYAFFFHSRDRQLRAALRDLIAGTTEQTPPVDYPFDGHHLAAVAWGDRPDETAEKIMLLLDAEARVTLAGASGTLLVWFAFSERDEGPESKIARSRLSLEEGAFVAFGQPGSGIAGFRASHQQAWRAYRVGRWSEQQITWYSEVALEALFLQDLQAARDFVAQQLGALAHTQNRADVLLDTLRAYFDAGCNAVRTASLLAVHERTVSYRLRSVESRLNVNVVERREELVVALRLQKALDAITVSGVVRR